MSQYQILPADITMEVWM